MSTLYRLQDSIIYGIDPGTRKSGFVTFNVADWNVELALEPSNQWLVEYLRERHKVDQHCGYKLAVETMTPYGARIGQEVMDTLIWTGRFMEAWQGEHYSLARRHIKEELGLTHKAKDADVRAALLEQVGYPGTRTNPGRTFGCGGHRWAALAVAVATYRNLARVEAGITDD